MQCQFFRVRQSQPFKITRVDLVRQFSASVTIKNTIEIKISTH